MAQSFGEMLGWVPHSKSLGDSLSRAFGYARAQSHQEVDLEHLLLALTADPDATAIMEVCGITTDAINVDVSKLLENLEEGEGGDPDVSQALVKIMEYAVAAARQSKRREVNGAIVLAAIVGEGKSSAAELLCHHGLTFEAAIRALQSATVKARMQDNAARQLDREKEPRRPAAAGASTDEILATARERVSQRGAQAVAKSRARGDSQGEAEQSDDSVLDVDRKADVSAARDQEVTEAAPDKGQSAPAGGHEADAAVDAGSRAEDGSVSSGDSPAREPAAPDAAAGWAPSLPGLSGRLAKKRQRGPLPPPLPPAPSVQSEQANVQGRRRAASEPPWQDGEANQVETLPPEATARMQAEPRRGQARAESFDQPYPSEVPLEPAGRVRTSFDPGELLENIPRRMRVGIAETIEIRVARTGIAGADQGMAGPGSVQRHDIVVTKAMAVRLRAPEGGFAIEAAMPETQWINNVLGIYGDDYASWRFVVTPQIAGRWRLQLIVSARTVGGDGLMAETAMPDQVIEVRVRTNYAKVASKWLGWIAAAVVGGLLARFGEGMWSIAAPVFRAFLDVG